jgi:nucleoside-diphosphate-sugar epimerase
MRIYGEAAGLVGEDVKPSATGPYAAAKITCENIIGDFVAAGLDAVILRPGIVHGPGSWAWTWRIASLLRAGRIGDLGPLGEGFCNLITPGDVARAAVAALVATNIAGEAINLGSTDPPSWNAYFASLAHAIGLPRPARISPLRVCAETRCLAPLLRAALLAAGFCGAAERALPPPIPPSLARLWRQRIRLDHRKADALLGFARTPDDEAIDQAARWLREQAGRAENRGRARHDLAKLDPISPPT